MKRTVLFIAMFLLLLSFDSASIQQQESLESIDDAFVSAVTGIVSISPCALKPKWSDIYQSGSFAAGPGEAYISNSATAPADMFAPVNLPNGALIKKVIGLCYDNDGTSASNYVLMRLQRRNNYTNINQTVAQLSTDGLAPSLNKRIRKTSSITYPTVDNTYAYSLDVSFGPDGSNGLIFYGFWIIYE